MRDIALVVFVAALLPFCVRRPWIGIILWFWFGLMAPHFLLWGFGRSVPFAMAVAGFTLLGWAVSKDDRQPIEWNRVVVLSVVLFFYYTFTTLFAWAPEAAWDYLSKVAKMMIMLIVMLSVIHGYSRIRWLMIVTVLSVGFYGFKGGIWALATGGENMVMAGTGTHTLAGNTALGLALVAVVPLAFEIARCETRVLFKRGLYAVAMLSTVAVPFTYSRGALVGLAAVFPFIFPRIRRFIVVLPVLAVMGYVFQDYLPDRLVKRAETIETYQEDGSAMQRIRAWTVAWNLVKDYPLTGGGFDFEAASNRSGWWSYAGDFAMVDFLGGNRHTAHSIWFQVLGQHGYLAFLLFVLMLLFAFVDLARIRRRAALIVEAYWIERYSRGISIGLLGYLVCGTFLNLAYFDLLYIYLFSTSLLHRELNRCERESKLGANPSPLGSKTNPRKSSAGPARGRVGRPASV